MLNLMKKNKKGVVQVSDIPNIVLMLALGVLIVAFVLQILGDVQSDMTPDSAEANATAEGITGLANLSEKWGLIGTIVAIAIIIGLLFMAFPMFKGGQ